MEKCAGGPACRITEYQDRADKNREAENSFQILEKVDLA